MIMLEIICVRISRQNGTETFFSFFRKSMYASRNKGTKRSRETQNNVKSLIFLFIKIIFSVFLGVHGNLFIILLKGGKILTSFGEFTLFHTLTHIPVNESTLGVHEIELVINTRKSLSNGSVVGNHATCSLCLG